MRESVRQVQSVRSKVVIRVHTYNGVEESVREQNVVGFDADQEHLVVKAKRANPLQAIAGVDPEIGGLDLQPEFLCQKY